MKTETLIKRKFCFKETNCTIISDSEKAVNAAVSSIKKNRDELEGYVSEHPEFLYSLSPVKVRDGPKTAILMAEYAERANVGPMAAVAGVLADLAVDEMISAGSQVAIVENGGEISAVSSRPIDVALLAGSHPLSKGLGFRLKDFPIGVATSSALFSHALSLGEAEAVTIFADNAGLADAAATAIGNIVKGDNPKFIVEKALRKAMEIEGVKGVFIIYRNFVGKCGQIPEIIKIKDSPLF